jgi:hypothetical protein
MSQPIVGLSHQAMVNMQCDDIETEFDRRTRRDMQQRCRVAATAESDSDASLRRSRFCQRALVSVKRP